MVSPPPRREVRRRHIGERPVGAARTRRLGGRGEYDRTVAVRFTPPDGVTPGIAGAVVDGRVDHVDLSATIIDLARRGHLTLTAVQTDGAHAAGTAPLDWRLTRRTSEDPLRPYEANLLSDLAPDGGSALLSTLKPTFQTTLRRAQIGLYREVVDHGWYRQHPRARNARLAVLGVPLLVIGFLLLVAAVVGIARGRAHLLELTPGIALLGAGALLLRGGYGRTPRTAAGTAVRIQTLGFREYLTTAEADQIRFEEASDIFSRYLPYAIVFGCAGRWSQIFGEVAAGGHLSGAGDAYLSLDWIDGVDQLANALPDVGPDLVRVVDAFDGSDLPTLDVPDINGFNVLDGLGSLDLVDTMSSGLGDLANGLGDLANGLGDFVGSVGDLTDGLSGCGDGCDAGRDLF